MKVVYYPGCTLKTHAKNFEKSALYSLNQLKIEYQELQRWNCCGTVFSLANDDLMHHLAPIRNLIRVKEAGAKVLMTLCSMCFNTIKRANERVKSNPEELEKLNKFMYKESTDYYGEVEVLHYIELLKRHITFEELERRVKNKLNNLKVACYYGCLLVRPKEIGIDDVENPTILEKLMESLGAKPIDFPFKTECCGAYQTVHNIDSITKRTNHILSSARKQGAEVVVASCPLCAFNLDHRQKETQERYKNFKNIPILYFTQLLAIALGSKDKDILEWDLHYVNPVPILKEKKII